MLIRVATSLPANTALSPKWVPHALYDGRSHATAVAYPPVPAVSLAPAYTSLREVIVGVKDFLEEKAERLTVDTYEKVGDFRASRPVVCGLAWCATRYDSSCIRVAPVRTPRGIVI